MSLRTSYRVPVVLGPAKSVAGATVFAVGMISCVAVWASDQTAARQLLNRHVLDALSRAVQTSPTVTNPMRDSQVLSRRALMDQLDQQAFLASQQKPTPKLDVIPIREATQTVVTQPVVQPQPVQSQPQPLATPIDARPIMALATDSPEPQPTRELPQLSPLRGMASPASAVAELQPPPVKIVEPRALPVTEASGTNEPVRKIEPPRSAEPMNWTRAVDRSVPPVTPPSSANPLRSGHPSALQPTATRPSGNPLRP